MKPRLLSHLTHLKPYTLVSVTVPDRVEGRERSYVGEVMSFPIPADDSRPRFDVGGVVTAINPGGDPTPTVMVRRVPGEPCSLDELPVDWVHRLSGPRPQYVHYAEVSGIGGFPVDMLRYDQAVPVNFIVTDEYPNFRIVESYGERPIVATTAQTVGDRPWCVDRWRSFGWVVKEVRTHRLG